MKDMDKYEMTGMSIKDYVDDDNKWRVRRNNPQVSEEMVERCRYKGDMKQYFEDRIMMNKEYVGMPEVAVRFKKKNEEEVIITLAEHDESFVFVSEKSKGKISALSIDYLYHDEEEDELYERGYEFVINKIKNLDFAGQMIIPENGKYIFKNDFRKISDFLDGKRDINGKLLPSDDNKPESMECINYNKVENDNLENLLKSVVKVNNIEKYDDHTGKSVYKNKEGNNVFVLERKILNDRNNYKMDIWQFRDDFRKIDAKEFIKQFDNFQEEKKNERKKGHEEHHGQARK